MKKINLSTLKQHLSRTPIYTAPNGSVIKFINLMGYFTVTRDGISKHYWDLRDAWKAM